MQSKVASTTSLTRKTLPVVLACTFITLIISALCLYAVLSNHHSDLQINQIESLNAKGMTPVIPLQMEFQHSLFLDAALQQADVGSVPASEYDAERIAGVLRQTLDDLRHIK